MSRCQCLTTSGQQCTRPAITKKTKSTDQLIYCWQHQDCLKSIKSQTSEVKKKTQISEIKKKIPVNLKESEIKKKTPIKPNLPITSRKIVGLGDMPEDVLFEMSLNLDCHALENFCNTSTATENFCDKYLEKILLSKLKSSGFDLKKPNIEKLKYLCHVMSVPQELPLSHFIDDSGQVYVWGNNEYGQLGLGDEDNRSNPELMTSFANTKIIQLFDNSDSTSLFLTNENQVYVCGLDVGTRPELINEIDNISIIRISAGFSHRLFLTDAGQVYGMGTNEYGQLGLGRGCYEIEFALIDTLPQIKIIQVIGRRYFSLFLTNTGQVYACGLNDYGQLGLGDVDNIYKPELIKSLNHVNIIQISAGEDYSLFLTDTGDVYACGKNGYGQLGLNDHTHRDKPTLITTFSSGKFPIKIIQVSAGVDHSLFLTNIGRVYACGSNEDGQLGFVGYGGDPRNRIYGANHPNPTPILIMDLNHMKIIRVSAGDSYSRFLTDTGQFYACGYNGAGELGLGDFEDRDVPTPVPALNKLNGTQSGGYRSKFQKQKPLNKRR
jgi:alpha-tubulin suppressor-like RCC1 family protein